MRERVGMVDLTAFCQFDVTGPGALDGLQCLAVNQLDVPVGKAVYTPLLTPDGGFRGDLTIQRLGPEHFRIVSGAFDGGRDQYWFAKYLPADGSVTFTDMSAALCTIGVWGPKARGWCSPCARPTSRNDAFPFGSVHETLIDGIPVTMFRISYVGDLGWEITTRMEHGLKLWDTLWEAGQPHGVLPSGSASTR